MTTRREIVLAAMSTAEHSAFEPVHVQKLFFLIDRRLGESLGGPHFDFAPYDYGPYDSNVYGTLEALRRDGFVAITEAPGVKKIYRLTSTGIAEGRRILEGIEPQIRAKLADLVNWVRERGFRELVAAIYREYPDMKVKSVFRE